MRLFNNKGSGKYLFILLFIVFVGSLVRLWGIDFGLPHTQCRPDQYQCVLILTAPLRNFHPRDFIYPSFYKYILLFVYAFYFIWGMVSGRFNSLNDFMAEFAIDPSVFYLIDRVLSAAFGVLTVVIIYYIARRLFNEKIAVVSSFFLSLAYLHIKLSHFGGVDVPMTFFIMVSIFLILKCYESKSLKDYFVSGICAGLAASTKYPAALLIVTMFITHFLNCGELKEKKISCLLDKRITVFLFTFVLGFLAGTPFALIDLRNFIDTFFFAVKATGVSSGNYINPPKQAWWYHLSLTLFFGLGSPLLFASLAGIAVFFKMNWRKALLVFSFPVVYYSVFASGFVPMTRYMVPLVPFFCLTAALFVCVFAEKIFRYFKIKPSMSVIYFTALLFIMPSLFNAVHFDRLLAKKDNRLVAGEWITKNIASGSSICQVIDNWYAELQLFPSRQYLTRKYNVVKEEIQRSGKGKFTLMDIEYKLDFLINSNIMNYNEWTYDAKSNTFLFVDRKMDSLPDYIVTSDKDPGVLQSAVTDKLRKILLHSYHLKKAFIVNQMEDKRNIYDRFDAFFLPFSGFKGVERPGPNFWIYERND
jgi:phage shock protein PspC (stress-responsive transcriptional regulator)